MVTKIEANSAARIRRIIAKLEDEITDINCELEVTRGRQARRPLNQRLHRLQQQRAWLMTTRGYAGE